MVNELNDGLSKPDQTVINADSDYSASFQAGSVEPTAATAKVVVFDPAFATAPGVSLTISESGTGNASLTFVGAGSFGFLGTSGIEYNWTAIR